MRPTPLSRLSAHHALIVLVAGVTLFRLWAAASIPLTEDEAYYRLWAASPQFGYYDHPPMIAWWIALGRMMAGDTPLGVRLIPVLSCAVTSLLIFDLARRLKAPPAAAARAAVWFNATLLIGAGGVLAIPDAAAVPFWTLTLWCLVRTEAADGGPWWLAAGLAAGLACLSKYSALFLAPGVLLWLILKPGGLGALRKPWPWLAAAVAGGVFAVNVAWNAEHHWMSFAKQFGRIAASRWAPGYLLELIGSQILLLNPLIAVFAAVGVAGRRPRATATPNMSLIVASSLPFAAYLAVHALHDRVQAHWPAPLYPGLALCAALAAERLGARGAWGWSRRIAAPLGLSLAAVTLIHAAMPATDITGLNDPAAPLRGWPRFAGQVEAVRIARQAAWVGSMSYATTALLADQPALKAPSIELVERERYPAADGSWRVDLSRPGLVIDLQRRLDARTLQRCFNSVVPAGPMARGAGRGAGQRYVAFAVAAPKRDILKDGC